MGQLNDIAEKIYDTEFFDEVATPEAIEDAKTRISTQFRNQYRTVKYFNKRKF